MAKVIKDLRNGRIYKVIEEDEDTYTYEKGHIVGIVGVHKINPDGSKRFKIMK